MTRRIVAAILLAVWTTLIVGGVTAYVLVRSILLEDLDSSIVERAATLIETSHAGQSPQRPLPQPRDRFFMTDASGQTIARMPAPAASPQAPRIISRAFTTLGDGQRMRTLSLRSEAMNETSVERSPQVQLVYSTPTDAFDRTLTQLAWTLLWGGLAAGIFAAGVARFVARRALAPLREATDVIRAVDLHHLDQRLKPEPLPEELRPVAITLNEMLALLQNAVQERQQFLADASHELRTPLASLVLAMEVSLSRPRSQVEQRQTLERCLNSANSLRQIVEQLLDQIRGDHPGGSDEAQPVLVADCVNLACTRHAAMALAKDISINQQCNPYLRVLTQPHRLQSIISNLVSNAVAHNRRGGWVNVAVEHVGGRLILTVSDNGPGIAPEHHARVFEPFYRINASRDAMDGHVGLGLFLVASHVRAMGGEHELKSSANLGTTIRISLPNCPVVPTLVPEESEAQPVVSS